MKKLWVAAVGLLVLLVLAAIVPCLRAGQTKEDSRYQVLAPIRNGNLTIFPVVAESSHNTGQFLTLDEGLRSGEVVVTESGNAGPRPWHGWLRSERPKAQNSSIFPEIIATLSAATPYADAKR